MPASADVVAAVAVAGAPRPLAPSWQAVVLVCRDCDKRGGGPKRLTGKAVRSALKDALRSARLRARVVSSSCLGPCPKKAITVAALAPGQAAAVAAVRSLDEIAAFVAPLAPLAPTR